MKFVDKFEDGYSFRIGNIEMRKSYNIFGENPYIDVVKWYLNAYYGKEKDYDYDPNEHCYRPKDDRYMFVKISESCFKHPETCYSLSTFKEDRDEEPDVITVGARPYELSDEDFLDYKKVIKHFYEVYYNDNEDE